MNTWVSTNCSMPQNTGWMQPTIFNNHQVQPQIQMSQQEQIKQQIHEARQKAQKVAAGIMTENSFHNPQTKPIPLIPAALRDFSKKESKEFQDILDRLNGSKDSIKNAKLWTVKHGASCKQIALNILEKARSLSNFNFDQKLFVLYLVNDILHESICQRTKIEVLDSMSLAMLHVLPELLMRSYNGSGESEKKRLHSLLDLWYNRLIFNACTVEELREGMVNSRISDKEIKQAETVNLRKNMKASSLHLTPGFLLDLARGMPPYMPLDPRRIPRTQENVPLDPDEGIFSQLESLERDLGDIGFEYRRNVLDYRRRCYV